MSNNTQSDRNFNVIIKGFGYINRVREINPNNGNPYLACDVALLQGVGDNVKNVRVNCVIRGRNAQQIVRSHFTSPEGKVVHPENTTVVASMTLGGITAQNFIYKKGDKKGQTGIALRSSLLSVSWLKIGNTVVDLETYDNGQTANGSSRPAASGQPGFAHEIQAEYDEYGCVRLTKDHPEFEARKQFLKDKGFTWDKQNSVWVRKDDGGVAESAAPQSMPPAGRFEDAGDWDDDIPF